MFKGVTKSGVQFQVDGGKILSPDPQLEKILRLLCQLRMPYNYYPTDRDRENAIGHKIIAITDGTVIQTSDAPIDDFDTHGPPDENGLCRGIIH